MNQSELYQTNFQFENQTDFYRGKVRDVYYFNEIMIVVATDRISAFDVILPRTIPYKGQVLNQLAAYHLQAVSSIVPHWLLQVPDPNVSIGLRCKPFPIEMVIRGYISGHAWREYKLGKRILCGEKLPEGLRENDPLPQPIITPTTKALQGSHDQDISKDEIIHQGLVSKKDYEVLEQYTYSLFKKGQELAQEKNLILVDAKYEFGKKENKIYLIDEIHTPDASRYFYLNTYAENQQKRLPQHQLSKEFVREWLIQHGFQGQQEQSVPIMTDSFVKEVSQRYITLFEQLTGTSFVKSSIEDTVNRIKNNILANLKNWL